MTHLTKIISGGQTGADRAALDFAIDHHISYGGCVPRGRKTEDGCLPEKYRLRELHTSSYAKRTEQNVLDADGTVIISHGVLTGGSALTRDFAKRHKKSWIHLNLNELSLEEASQKLLSWLESNKIKVLNVAGSKAGKDPKIYDATLHLLKISLAKKESV